MEERILFGAAQSQEIRNRTLASAIKNDRRHQSPLVKAAGNRNLRGAVAAAAAMADDPEKPSPVSSGKELADSDSSGSESH